MRYPWNVYHSKQKLVWIGYKDNDELIEYSLSEITKIEILPVPEYYSVSGTHKMEIYFHQCIDEKDSEITVYKIDICKGDWEYLVEKFDKFIVCK